MLPDLFITIVFVSFVLVLALAGLDVAREEPRRDSSGVPCSTQVWHERCGAAASSRASLWNVSEPDAARHPRAVA
jgi:hypothetical protein